MFAIAYTFAYWGTCIEYVACSFLQNPEKIPVTTKLRLKATDQDTEIDAEINYEMIRGMKCICIYVINIDRTNPGRLSDRPFISLESN
jgi:hypothetical protein